MSLAADIRLALRALRKAPLFTCAAAGVLALAIAATTAIFSLADAVLLRPLPYADAQRLVAVRQRLPNGSAADVPMLDFLDWSEQNSVFDGMAAAVSGGPIDVPLSDEGGGPPEIVRLHDVTATFFAVLGVRPLLGRTFTTGDDTADVGLLMSERLWRGRFGADPAIVGRTIRVSSPPRSRPIIGIVPAAVTTVSDADLWELLPVERGNGGRGQGVLQVMARLRPGVTMTQAQAGMEVVARNVERVTPATNTGRGVVVLPLRDVMIGRDLQVTTVVLVGIVGFLLLLACANVANLVLARGVGRMREMAVRSALGGTALRIAAHLLTESFVLAAVGGVAGLVLAVGLIRAASILPPAGTLPPGIALTIDWRVALFATAVTSLTAVLFGIAPCWQALQRSAGGLVLGGGRGIIDSATRLRHGLTIVEIAVALLLTTGAGLLARTLVSLTRVDGGYRADNVVTMGIRLPFRQLVSAQPGDLGRYWQAMETAVAALPGVRAVALGSTVPLAGLGAIDTTPFTLDGAGTGVDPATPPTTVYTSVTPQYFSVLGIPIVRGRPFSARDDDTAPAVAIVDESFVRQYLDGRMPIGVRVTVQNPIRFRSPTVTREIVGVVRRVRTRADEASALPHIYVPLMQNNWLSPTLIVRSATPPMRLLPEIRSAVSRVDPTQAVANVRTMEMVAADATARPRLRTQVVGSFAVLALALSAAGVFSLLMFTVQQRRQEFSIRLAVGASARDLLRLVFGQTLRISAAGVVVGVVASALLARTLRTLLFGVSTIDPLTFVGAPLLLLAIALLACVWPAVRAARADPAAVLRSE